MYEAYLKVFLDKILAFIALVVFSPIILVLAILIRFFFGSPVLFKQTRPGLHGKPFILYKFRTMKVIYDSEGQLLSDRERLTKFGKFLRRFSLDELPELFNVLKGDMSLVGPRPLLMKYLQHYNKVQARRHEVKPGITGLAQIRGRQNIPFSKRLEFDVYYVEHYKFFLDMKILFYTIAKVLFCQGVHSGQDVTLVDDLGLNSKVGKRKI